MFDWIFGRKKVVERVEEDTKKSFDFVKKDVNNLSVWIKHLDSEKNLQRKEIEEIKDTLSTIESEVENIKNVISLSGRLGVQGNSKHFKRLTNKQVAVYADQTADQTADQSPNLDYFSLTERAILWVMLNTDMKLSYEDIAAMLGKERSTIRNQINNIKQKSEGLIEEVIEKNGKKRVFIVENMKEKLIKKPKVRVNNAKNNRKMRKVSDY